MFVRYKDKTFFIHTQIFFELKNYLLVTMNKSFTKRRHIHEANIRLEKRYLREGTELDVFPVDGGFNIGWDEDAKNFNDPKGTANSDFSEKPTYAGAGGHLKGHFGIDIFGKRGTPIVAPVGGKIKLHFGNGNTVIVQDVDGYSHWLGHLDSITVKDGEFVKAGTQVGTLGDSGNAKGTTPHLHYNVYPTKGGFYSGKDPIKDLKAAIGKKPSSVQDDEFDFSELDGGIISKIKSLYKDLTGGSKMKPEIVKADDAEDILTIVKNKGKEFIQGLENLLS